MRVDRLEREFDVSVEWWPFELHPEIPPEGIARRERSERAAYYENLQQLMAEAGLEFRRPPVVANSHRSLEAAEFAREHGAFEAMHAALFRAYFAEGRNIGDVAVLAELAAESGSDAADLREALAAKRYAELVDRRTAEARAWGVTGTPAFVFEGGERRFVLVGAQDHTVFENVARRLGARARTENQEPRTGLEQKHGPRF